MKALIIIPTYNEKENIEDITGAVLALPHDFEVLIVDDNSPDGTGDIADRLAENDPRIHVLHRVKKQGLGPAYIAGFRWGLSREYDLFFEMDADFSHRPDYLNDFMEAVSYTHLTLPTKRIV